MGFSRSNVGFPRNFGFLDPEGLNFGLIQKMILVFLVESRHAKSDAVYRLFLCRFVFEISEGGGGAVTRPPRRF